MIFSFLAQNEHGRALVALIRAIRACPACFPELYITCPEHRAELDRLYPEHCPDANCPACAADRPPVERVPDEPPAACSCTPHPLFGHHDDCRYVGMGPIPPAVHDNGDYHD